MFEIHDRAIDVADLIGAVSDPEAGAIATFIGTTRNNNEGRDVTTLEYEAYPEMAVTEMQRIGEQAKAQWPIRSIAIAHRIGVVPIGEASVVIAVSSPHRAAAFEAARFAIDRLKEVVPIWKKEHFEGGEVWIGSQKGEAFPSGESGPRR